MLSVFDMVDQLSSLPSHSVSGKPMSIEHAFSCSFGGFPIIRHTEALLSEACHNVHLYSLCQGKSSTIDLQILSAHIDVNAEFLGTG